MPVEQRTSAEHRTSPHRRRIPSPGAGLPALETACWRRKAELQRRTREPAACEAGLSGGVLSVLVSSSAHCRTFAANCLRHGKTLGSTLCGHISRANASDVRSFSRDAAALFLGTSVMAGACRNAHGARTGRGRGDSHRRGMEAVARTGHCRSASVLDPAGIAQDPFRSDDSWVRHRAFAAALPRFCRAACWHGRRTSAAIRHRTGDGFREFRFSRVGSFWARRYGTWRGGSAEIPEDLSRSHSIVSLLL